MNIDHWPAANLGVAPCFRLRRFCWGESIVVEDEPEGESVSVVFHFLLVRPRAAGIKLGRIANQEETYLKKDRLLATLRVRGSGCAVCNRGGHSSLFAHGLVELFYRQRFAIEQLKQRIIHLDRRRLYRAGLGQSLRLDQQFG